MRLTRTIAPAVALVCAAIGVSGTQAGAQRHAAPTTTSTSATPDSSHTNSTSTPRLRAMHAGFAEPVAAPNANSVDRDLGARVVARNIPIPAVGQSGGATFLFDGTHRGWVRRMGAQLLTSAAYAHGRVYLGAGFSSRTVYALDAYTGNQDWEASTPDGGPTAAIVDDGKVYFNTESCTLFAFDMRTGQRVWSRYLGDPLMSQAVAAHGLVFSAYPGGTQSGSGRPYSFTALAASDGTPRWVRPIPADVITAPVAVGDSIFATTMDGTVFRFRALDGNVLWRRELTATSAPAVFADRVYVAQRVSGGRERQLTLSAIDGTTLESGDATDAGYAAQRADTGGVPAGWGYEGSRPVYADGRIYYAMGDTIRARDAATGRVVWQRHYPHPSTDRGMTSPSVVGSMLVVGTRDGDVFGMDIDTGATEWAYHVGEPVAFQPTVANGWVYVTTASGRVLGLEVADRTLDGWHMWGGNAQHAGLAPSEPQAPEPPAPSQGTFRASGENGQPFPLLHTEVQADVAGFVARVEVTQTFSNPASAPVDAEYLFPLPGDAAVDAMELQVGSRTIHGEIHERNEARQIYTVARAEGHTAALLEQERPNVFRQAVANVRPGEPVRVVLRFAEPVPYRNGHYEFSFPLATGSRYTPGQGGSTPVRPPGDVRIRAHIDMGLPVDGIESPSHAIHTEHAFGANAVDVAFAGGSERPDRDFVLRYAPRVDRIGPAFLATRRGSEGFFTFALHPDTAIPAEEIAPRELVFVVDTSSSMRGAPMDQARTLMRRAVERLRPTDSFRIIRFSDIASTLSPGALEATAENRTRAAAFIDQLQAAGSTEMLEGLRAALNPPTDGHRVRLVVLITDGYIGNDRDIFSAVQRDLGDSRLFVFGVGPAVNRYLAEQIAEVGRGHVEIVLPSENAAIAADRFYATIDRPVLSDVQIDWGGLDVGDVYPRRIPDLFADRPLLVHGRFGRAGEGDISIRGTLAGRPWQRSVHVALPATANDHEAIPSMWARARAGDLDRAMWLGETQPLREEMTQLGLAFGLVTNYTSFVAVDRTPVPVSVANAHHGTASPTTRETVSAEQPAQSTPTAPAAPADGRAGTGSIGGADREYVFSDDLIQGQLVTATAAPTAQVPIAAPAPVAQPFSSRGRAPAPSATRPVEELLGVATAGATARTTVAATDGAAAPTMAAATGEPRENGLQRRPTRAQITNTMQTARTSLLACLAGAHGVATFSLVLRSDGTIVTVTVSGPFTTAQNACMTAVLRNARFVPFSQPSLAIVVPLTL